MVGCGAGVENPFITAVFQPWLPLGSLGKILKLQLPGPHPNATARNPGLVGLRGRAWVQENELRVVPVGGQC